MKKKIAVMFGGRSAEHDISVITGLLALKNVNRSRYDVEAVYLKDGNFYMDGVDRIDAYSPFVAESHTKCVLVSGAFYAMKNNKISRRFKPDVALLCFHGGEGENGVVQSVLDFNNVAYTSADTTGSAICMNKRLSKVVFENMLLNVVPYKALQKDEFDVDRTRVFEMLESVIGYPMIVKPENLGSSIGISSAHNRDELESALEVAFDYDLNVIVEQLLSSFVEVNCAAVSDGENVVISETEQPPHWSDFLTFDDKYIAGGNSGKMTANGHVMPARIGYLAEQVRADTLKIYNELGLKGVVRIDYLVDTDKDKVYVNEVNSIPGSLAYYLFEPLGMSFEKLIDVQISAAQKAQLRKKRLSVAAPKVLEQLKGTKSGAKRPTRM